MQTKHRDLFTTVRTEGALLPADFLTRVTEGDRGIEGLAPEAYHLIPGEKINEAINRSWNRLLGAWASFRPSLENPPDNDPATSKTRERWLLPLFQELGYGRLQTSKAVEIDGKLYPISHSWQQTPIHLVGCGVSLDKVSAGVAGAARSSPHSLLQEFLNRSVDHLWGFVSNGRQLRILRDNISFTRQAYVQFDLESMMEGEVYADFVILWLICHQSRVEAERPEQCCLEKWSKSAQEQGTRVLDQLRIGVEEAITALGRGFLGCSANTSLREKLKSGALSTQDFYRQLLRAVYRLLFLFVAEDRDLLLDPHAANEAKDRFRLFYSTTKLRRLAERRRGTKHVDIWRGLSLIFRKFGEERGCTELGLPALDSFLWSDEATPDIDGCDIENRAFLDAVRALTLTIDRNVRRAVDYRNLGTEELGSIYESLLELQPVLNGDAGSFGLTTAQGHERKTTGSYYTPASLINCLLDSALAPVLDQAARTENPEAAILDLKVCDPACGSGHFLIASAHRIAKRLASARTGDEEPSPESVRTALRDVIGKCIYGVDINPMAVELCKVSLWMEALEPGKPLSFLEHHIVSGNSLLGATPTLLKQGIPDDAFKPIEGDDRKLCRDYKKSNKSEREGQCNLFDSEGQPWNRLGDLVTSMMELDHIDDSTIEGVRNKQKRFEDLIRSTGYMYGHLWADAWCGAFVWKKGNVPGLPYAITHEAFLKIGQNPHSVPSWMRDEIKRLADQYHFFHWHLAFPDVFRIPGSNEEPENRQAGWSGGFDVVVGNPPWERIKLQEKEWFAERRPDITNASTAAVRTQMITRLKSEDPALYQAFLEDRRIAEGESHLIRDSESYPLCGRGDVNTYAIFAELSRSVINARGRFGCIVPSGIATDDTTKLFFQKLTASGCLVSLYSFENEEFIFPAVHHATKFCLLTCSGSKETQKRSDFVFFARQTADLKDENRHFSLSLEDLALLNPNTRTCAIFRRKKDAEITKAVYGRVPILIKDGSSEENAWAIRFLRMFEAAGDSNLFKSRNELELDGWSLRGNRFQKSHEVFLPLYEGRMIHQFDHRSASIITNPGATLRKSLTTETTVEQYRNPDFYPLPLRWVSANAVSEATQGEQTCNWLIGFRDVTSATSERTAIFSVIPLTAVVHSCPLVFMGKEDVYGKVFLVANLNSCIFDFVARQKVGGTHMTYTYLKQLPVLPPAASNEKPKWDAEKPLRVWCLPRVLELSYTAWDLQAFGTDCGYEGPPFRWDEERRLMIRSELDAAFFHLYEVERNDVDYIMDTFNLVKARDEKKYGEYRTKRMILEVYDAMAEAIRTGDNYRTILSPPPADPNMAHPPRCDTQ